MNILRFGHLLLYYLKGLQRVAMTVHPPYVVKFVLICLWKIYFSFKTFPKKTNVKNGKFFSRIEPVEIF